MSAFADEERKRRRATTGVFCLVLLGLTLAALAHVAVQAKRAEVAAALGREQAAHHELLDRRRHLLIEIGQRKDPARLEKVARETLGMEAPLPTNIRAVGREPLGERDEPIGRTAPVRREAPAGRDAPAARTTPLKRGAPSGREAAREAPVTRGRP